MWNYNSKVMDYFLHPRNVGEIPDAEATAEVGNMTCGDALRIYLKIDKDHRITDAKFKTFGCASAIASSSILTEIVKGMTIEEAAKVTNRDIVDALGELPEEKMHCSVMGMEALQAALGKYAKEHGLTLPEIKDADPDDHEGRIVCKCFGVTDAKIRKVIKLNHLTTLAQVTEYTKAGGACGSCLDQIQQILDEVNRTRTTAESPAPSPAADFESLSPVKKALKVQEVIDKEIKPALERDGGSIELIDLNGNVVTVALRGICATCPNSKLTLQKLVQGKLNEFLSDKLVVVEEQANHG